MFLFYSLGGEPSFSAINAVDFGELLNFLFCLLPVVLLQIAALFLDHVLGEPKRFHPLVGFGRIISFLEEKLNIREFSNKTLMRFKGAFAWLLAVVPLTILSILILWIAVQFSLVLFWFLNCFILYLTLGLKSLKQHASWVSEPLDKGDLEGGRAKVSWLVSRHTEKMNQTQIIKACIESVLENGSDAVYGALFWFAVVGAPGALLYRLSNTLDASWGYRSERFLHFGFCAARMDDLLNLIPARICSLAYSLCGNTTDALASWKRIRLWRKANGRKTDGRDISSPNAGIVMASGAGALNLSLGGAAIYDGIQQTKPELGSGDTPQIVDIRRSQVLLNRSVILFVLFQLFLVGVALVSGVSFV